MAPTFVKRYLIALDRHKWAGLAGFTVVMGLSGVAALQPPPPETFTAEGVLTYSSPPIILSQTGTALQAQGQALTKERLLSNYVIEETVKALSEQQIQTDAGTLRRNTTVKVNSGDEKGLSVLINYVNPNGDVAKASMEQLMNKMVDQSRLFNTQQLEFIATNLNELLPRITRELRDTEQKLERYVRVEGPQIQAARDGDVLGALTGGQSQQRQIRYTLDGVEAQIRSIQSRLGLNPDQAYAASVLSSDPIIADLRSQIYSVESQMTMLSQTLRPEHPNMVTLQNQKRGFEQLLQQRVAEVIGQNRFSVSLQSMAAIRQNSSLDPTQQQYATALHNLQLQRETLQQQLAQLERSEQELRQEYIRIPNKQLELARLQQQVALKRTFYDQVQARLVDLEIARNETVGSLVIAQAPETKRTAEKRTNPVLILGVGAVVGLLVGGGLVLLLDSLDATFHTLPDLQAALRQQDVPVLGLLPIMSVKELETLPLVVEPDSPYMEPYERFRGTLRRAGGGKTFKLVLMTSTVNEEGKTVTVYNLAIASARAGKRTLIIEADLRSPSHAKALKVAPDPGSMLEPLRYYGNLNDCIRLVPEIENLYVLPSPGIQRQAAAILESSEMRQLLEDVRGRFDLVVIDTPALSRFSDALLLEPYTDGMVLVTRPGYTEEGILSEAIEQFNESEEIRFLGSAINGADIAIQVEAAPPNKEDQFLVEDLDTQPDLDGIAIGSREF